MDKRIAVLFVCFIICSLGFSAAEQSDYPEIRMDPSTGSAYNLEGQTVYIYDYWSNENWDTATPFTENETATYNYRKWIEATYNCKVSTVRKGDRETCADELIRCAQNPDGKLCVFIVAPEKIHTVLQSGMVANWKNSGVIDVNDNKWNQGTIELTSRRSETYGLSAGKPEPTICLYFNKRILEEAGIDWNTIYDMQKNGTWNWEQFEIVLQKVHGDYDHDNIFDAYGLVGSSDDFYRAAVFSNGSSFFDYNSEGNLVSTVASEETKDALQWAKNIWTTYARAQRNEEAWNYYRNVWEKGQAAFYIYRAYGGFNENAEMSEMKDSWGCVAFPKGEKGTKYVTVISNNAAFIPNVYSNDQLSKIALIYDLWTSPTPGIMENELARFEGLTDNRAIYETYAMLSENSSLVADKTELLGNVNDVLGASLLWSLKSVDIDELLEEGEAYWNQIADEFNRSGESDDPSLADSNILILPADLKSVGERAFESIHAEIVRIPSSCKSIESHAFANNPQLKTVYVSRDILYIADDAFEGSNPEIIWTD